MPFFFGKGLGLFGKPLGNLWETFGICRYFYLFLLFLFSALYLCFAFKMMGWIASPTRQRATGQIRGGLANAPDSPQPLKLKAMTEELRQAADLITANTIFTTKEVLTSEEAAKYMGVSKSYLYKLTMSQKIPHYKPRGKMCYFNRLELEQWLQSNRVATNEELEERAQAYCMKKGGKR